MPLKKATELQKLAQERGLSLYVKRPGVQEGWLNKPKGLKQVLWEIGYIDPAHKDEYRNKHNDPRFCLTLLLASCSDFCKEKSRLEKLADDIGAKLITTPKYHAEMAGEGIEYTWAHAKWKFWCEPLRKKKTKAQFLELVKLCLSSKAISKSLVRKVSRKARMYMIAYYLYEHHLIEFDSNGNAKFVCSQ